MLNFRKIAWILFLMRGRRIETAVRIRSELAHISPEGESIKPDDEDVDTEHLGFDKTEGDETAFQETDEKEK
jgi:hypothetical protein